MGTEIFGFCQKLGPWQLELGLEWTFWTFSVLKMIVLLLAIWWAQIFLKLGLICAWCSCWKRVTVKLQWMILPQLFLQTPITWAWSRLLRRFQSLTYLPCLGSLVCTASLCVLPDLCRWQLLEEGRFWGGLLVVDFTLACCQPNIVINHFFTY